MQKNSVTYDKMAKGLRADPTSVVRVRAGKGLSQSTIRQAMRQRGLYVRVSARSEDRPFISVELDDNFKPGDALATEPALPMATRQDLLDALRAAGIDPKEA